MEKAMAVPEAEAVIEARALTRRFGSFVAVDAVDLDVAGGEIFGLLGANGAGKTTTIRMLTGLLRPSSGSGRVAGFDVARSPLALRERIGYMSQRFSLYEDLTVTENLEFFAAAYGLSGQEAERAIERVMESTGIGPLAGRLAGSLPLGWKQRLALGSAMLHGPDVLFLDEPTAGVDPSSRRRFWHLIYEAAGAGTTVLVTTHYMDEAEYCHRLAIMRSGRIAATGTPAGLRERFEADTMEEVFLKIAEGEEVDS